MTLTQLEEQVPALKEYIKICLRIYETGVR